MVKIMEILQRMKEYDQTHCWQYDIRLKNLQDDLRYANITKEESDKLTVSDFEFKCVEGTSKDKKPLIEFIKRHEWLGTISQYPTHWFGCYYKDILAGVLIFNMPNAFSKLLGEETRSKERLISRGACISWSPKNLASKFLMWSINYMVKNTSYRLFTAYSDPMAKELGTIYQACNFYYLGKKSGTVTRYINPYTGKMVSDRFFRVRSAYKKYAKELNIVWGKNWNNDQKMLWENVPEEFEILLKNKSKEVQKESKKLSFPEKHKYAYVIGATKSETKKLRKIFLDRNKVYPYPKDR